MLEVLDWVTLGFVVFLLLVNVFCFWLIFSYFSLIQHDISSASTNFQASNESIAEAIISLGTLLDDLDEVSGDLVRPPAIGDVIAQGLQMFMFQKMQSLVPGELAPMFKDQRKVGAETWQDVSQNEEHDLSTKEHSK